MDLTQTILGDVREAIGLSTEPSTFDKELLMHINSMIGTLNQNGIGNFVVADSTTTWKELQNPVQVNGNRYFAMIPLLITLSTKLIFDPPPPSNVQYYQNNIDQTLWRLKLAYEEPLVQSPTLEEGDI